MESRDLPAQAGTERPLPHEVWHLKEALAEVTVREIPPPEVMPRLATEDEMPDAAKQVAKKLRANDWLVRVEYGKHSWPKQAEKVENDNGDVTEKIPFGIVESIVVKGKRGGVRLFAQWMTKPWTKDGDKYKFFVAHVIPKVGKVKSAELRKVIESERVNTLDSSVD